MTPLTKIWKVIMDKNTTIGFVLIGIILMVWLYFNSTPNQDQQKNNQPKTEQQKSAESKETPKEEPKQKTADAKTVDKNDELRDSLFLSTDNTEKVITLETDLAKIEMTSKGGQIKKYYLKNYKTWYYKNFKEDDFYNTHVQLINPKENGNLSVEFITKDKKIVNTAGLNFTIDKNQSYYKISGQDSISFKYSFSTKDGKTINKIYTFKGSDYLSRFDVQFENMETVVDKNYSIHWANGLDFLELNSVDEAAHAMTKIFTPDQIYTFDATSTERTSAEFPKQGTTPLANFWAGVRNKYFTAIIEPITQKTGTLSVSGKTEHNQYGQKEYYDIKLRAAYEPEKLHTNSYALYLGPIDYSKLKAYNRHYESIFEFSNFLMLGFIIRPISEYLFIPFLRFLHEFIPNYGIVIILFTLVLKILLHPLTKQSLKSMKKMQLLQPMITELKEKYKGDQPKVQKETAKLYSTYGINPAGGCLPTLLQMPILVALYTVFSVIIDMRLAPFTLWIDNLSAPDKILALPFALPLINQTLSGLALLMAITMFIQQKMTIKDPSQKAMIYMMPVMMFIMFNALPSGLNLYYLMFNLFSIAQQYYVNHRHDDVQLVPVDPSKKKSGFMVRMMEAAEKQAEAQKKGQKKK